MVASPVALRLMRWSMFATAKKMLRLVVIRRVGAKSFEYGNACRREQAVRCHDNEDYGKEEESKVFQRVCEGGDKVAQR